VLAVICIPSIDLYSATCWFPGPSEQLKGRWRRWPRGSSGSSGSTDWPLLSKMHQVKFSDKSDWDEFHTFVFTSFFKALQRDCSVDNVTRRRLDHPGFDPHQVQHTFSCSKCLQPIWRPIILLYSGQWVFVPSSGWSSRIVNWPLNSIYCWV